MVDLIKKELCNGCEACYNKCPENAIYMALDEEGFFSPQLYDNKCINCKKCVQVCPVKKNEKHKNEILYAVACYSKDVAIRSKSTSGGVFSVISDFIIENMNGIVYGVAFDNEFNTIYVNVEKKEDLGMLRGSKYVQCRVGKIYCEVKAQLDKGRCVLFSGLPCHIEALISFLDKDYSNLYLLDMACFGIASPYIWQEYLGNFHDKEKIKEIFFKDKTDGWKHWRVKFIEDGKEKLYQRKENLYMNSYLQKVNIRKSCFSCSFKGLQRRSDFTVADCWGEGEKNQRMNDDRGLSALLIHSKKGKEIFDRIKDKIEYEEYNADVLMRGNWAVYHAVQETVKRELFFRDLKDSSFKETFIKYFGTYEGECDS